MSDVRCVPGAGVEQRMRDAGLPADTLVARRATLPVAVQELHRRVLTAIADTGQPPAVPVAAPLASSVFGPGSTDGGSTGGLADALLRDGVPLPAELRRTAELFRAAQD